MPETPDTLERELLDGIESLAESNPEALHFTQLPSEPPRHQSTARHRLH